MVAYRIRTVKRLRSAISVNTAILAAALLVVGLLVVPPAAILILGSLTDSPPGARPHFALTAIREAFGTPVHLNSLLLSAVYAAFTATLVLVFGCLLAWLAERTDSTIKKMADWFVLAPIFMPAILLVSGWILLLDPRNGFVNLIAMEYLRFDRPPLNIFSFWGMVWIGVLQELPLAFLWLWPAFRSMNPDLEEAAQVAGASRWTVLRRIVLPLLRPAIFAAWIIFFIYSLGALSVALLVGIPAGIILYPAEIYLAANRIPSDLNLASAYSLFFILVTIVGIAVYRHSIAEAGRFSTITGKSFNPRVMRLGKWRPAATVFGVLLLLLVAGLPLLVLVWNAFMPYPTTPSWDSLSLATLDNFWAAWNYGPAIRSLRNSLVLGLGAGVVTTILGAAIAWCILRMKHYKTTVAILDQMATAPIAIPGMIVGVGLLWLYLTVPLPVYGTMWILLIAYVTLHIPYAVRISISGLSQIHSELEEAGEVAGANRFTVFRRIVITLLAPTLLGAAIYVTLRSFREYAASIFLASPGNEVMSVLVLDMWDGGNSNILSAYIMVVVVLLGVATTLFYWISRRVGIRSTKS